MPCYRSKPAWTTSANGRESISFQFRNDREPDYFVDCGKCEGCTARARNDWATRIYHESQMWDRNSFLTLTYDDRHLPETILREDIQKFIKRLRKQNDRPIRYYACGEYGERTRRPHYHAIIFNEDFLDSHFHYSINDKMYGDKKLERIWGKGQVTISEFNYARANYTAGYVTKKINDTDTFSLMSRRPPLGRTWVIKHKDNLRRNEKVVINGKELPIPRVYLNWLRGVEDYDHIKENLRNSMKTLNDQKLRAKRANYMAQESQRTKAI